MLRLFSLTLRKLQARKKISKTLAQYALWKDEIAKLEPPAEKSKRILIIRLDDIGDYLLFRNSLSQYKTCSRWKGYHITLLGFSLWKDLFEFADASSVDTTIWINKHDYFGDSGYRAKLWQQLSNAGFEVVICPSRVRPLLLDDMCMMAAAAPLNIGCYNNFIQKEWNEVSDIQYQELFADREIWHEFHFNNAFASWCCKLPFHMPRPVFPIDQALLPATIKPGVVCFVGASFKSRVWPAARWVDLIQMIKRGVPTKITLAGGKNDVAVAADIVAATGVDDLTGKVSLVEMAHIVAQATAVVSNNTMAAHLAVALDKPLIIVASGDNFAEFCAYTEAGITGVTTIYPKVFRTMWAKKKHQLFHHYVAVTNDIGTIKGQEIFDAFTRLKIPQPPAVPLA